MLIDAKGLKNLLNHRYPLLLLDGVTHFLEFKECKAFKNYTLNEWYFSAHFEDNPVLPASLLLESFSQAFAIPLLFQKSLPLDSKLPLIFAGADKFRVFNPVVPGDRVEFIVDNLRINNGIAIGHVIGIVQNELIGSANLTYKLNINE
jgi:3-hydroxyacyl-[acyl-carrier-protein] dehydratase